MTKLIFTSDWHCHDYPSSGYDKAGTNSKLADILAAGGLAVQAARDLGEHGYLIHGGDLFHNRKHIPVGCLARTAALFRQLPPDRAHVLDGNHDMTSTGDGASSVQALHGIVTAHSQVETTTLGEFRVGWLPYMDDPVEVKAATTKLLAQGAEILVAHLGLSDPRLADCVPADYELPGRINLSDLQHTRFKLVVLGHYHRTQTLAPNVIYIGSPLQLSYKESGHDKGYWTYTRAQGLTFIENTISPRYHIVDNDEALTFGQAADIAAGKDKVWFKRVSKAQADQLKLAYGANANVRIEAAPVVSTGARLDDTAKGVELLAAYVRTVSPDLDDSEVAALSRLGQELINAAG